MFMLRSKYVSFGCAVVLALITAVSCTYHRVSLDMEWDYTPGQRDSIIFARTHHYSQNYNFRVSADSIVLLPDITDSPAAYTGDTVSVYEDERLVVADFSYIPADSIDSVWIKVARDQYTIGWIHEKDLLENATPDDPISQFIHFFGNKRNAALCTLAAVAFIVLLIRLMHRKKIRIVHFNDIDSFYPALLCIDIAAVAMLYTTIQHFVPDTWQEFYFNPTLNPFVLPPILALFIIGIWLILLLAMAAADEAVRVLGIEGAMPYLLSLAGVAMAVYLIFSITTYIYAGYVLFPVYVVFAVMRHRRRRTYRYMCGRCGHKLRHKGICPYCGAHNV